MKQWTTAEVSGTCAYCGRGFKAQDRIGLVTGPTWQKRYDADCFRNYHNAPEDTGEVTDVTDQPGYPAPLKALAVEALKRLMPTSDPSVADFARAAANDRDDA